MTKQAAIKELQRAHAAVVRVTRLALATTTDIGEPDYPNEAVQAVRQELWVAVQAAHELAIDYCSILNWLNKKLSRAN